MTNTSINNSNELDFELNKEVNLGQEDRSYYLGV